MRPGLVALGDSITYGDVAPMLGVRSWSWAQWLATALELPYTGLAVPGARAEDVVAGQLPRLDGPYAVGCLWIGANDCRSPDFDAAAFGAAVLVAARALAGACERVVLVTVPLDLGRPRAGAAKVTAANAAIRDAAREVGAVVVDVAELRGWRLVLPDAVHLTALGELEVADRAYDALAAVPETRVADGARSAGLGRHAGPPGAGVADEARSARPRRHARPSALAEPDRSALGAARFAATGYAPSLVRDLARRAVEAARRRGAR